MTTKLTRAQIERLTSIKEEIKELAREAFRLVRGTKEEGRAHSYWYPHIVMSLDDDHSYLGKEMATMQGAVDGLTEELEDDEPLDTDTNERENDRRAQKH